MVSNKPGMDLAALSYYANAHGMSYGQLVSKIGPAQERAIIEDFEKNQEARLAERREKRQEQYAQAKDSWDRQEALRLWRMGYTDNQIGEALGVSPKVIFYWRHKIKLSANASRSSLAKDKEDKQRDTAGTGSKEDKQKDAARISSEEDEQRDTAGTGSKEDKQKDAARISSEEAMKLYEEGWPDSEMASYFGVTAYAISCWRRKNKLKSNQQREREQMQRTIEDMAELGCTAYEIGKAVGRPLESIVRYARKIGLKLRKAGDGGADPRRDGE